MSPVLVFLFFIAFAYFIWKKYKIFLVGIKIPGPWAVPLMGNVQLIPKLDPHHILQTINENRKKFKCSFRLWLGPDLWVFLYSPEETRDALNDPTLVKAETFNQLDALIGNGLLISHGKYWESQRRALTPAFHPNILNVFSDTIALHTMELVQILDATRGRTIEVTDFLFPCILDIIVDTSLGQKLNSQNYMNCKYRDAFHKAKELLFKRMVNPLLASNFIFRRTNMYRELCESLNIIHNLTENIIDGRSEFLKQHSKEIETFAKKKRLTLLDTLLTAEIEGQQMSRREIRDEVTTFVFAGVDTTTASMSFILYALAKYPAEQEKILKEIESLPADSDADMNEINKLEYLDMFIKECLRFYTIVPVTGRQTTTDTKIGGINYCAGITLWVNMYGLAHDEQIFTNANEFRPERFAKTEAHKIPPYTFIPFAGGPHICIGRKYAMNIMKIMIIKILQNFQIQLDNPDEELVLMAHMVLQSLHGVNLKFKVRV